METTWGPSGGYGDDVDDGDDVGMTGTTCGDHRPYGDLLGAMGMTGTMWGRRG